MFRRMMLLFFFLCGVPLALWVMHLSTMRRSDYEAFRTLASQEEMLQSKKSELPTSAYQTRQGVRKDIWFAQEDRSRLHYRIESRSSILMLNSQKNSAIDVVEHLNQIKCWMQDKIYYETAAQVPMQQMRFFEATEGVYHYMSQHFDAKAVALSLFRLPGHQLQTVLDPKFAFLKGVAQDVSFTISGKFPQFKAEQFKATLTRGEL